MQNATCTMKCKMRIAQSIILMQKFCPPNLRKQTKPSEQLNFSLTSILYLTMSNRWPPMAFCIMLPAPPSDYWFSLVGSETLCPLLRETRRPLTLFPLRPSCVSPFGGHWRALQYDVAPLNFILITAGHLLCYSPVISIAWPSNRFVVVR